MILTELRKLESDASGSPRRSHWLWVWAAVSALVVAAAFTAGTLVRSPWDAAIDNARNAPEVTAVVEQRELAPDLPPLAGQVVLGTSVPVLAPIPEQGRAVVTAAPTSAGDTLDAGEVLIEVSGRPLLALDLPFAAYRDLGPGATGPDVEAVQGALARLGFFTGELDGVYGPRTAAAVQKLYEHAGYPAPTVSEAALDAVDTAAKALDDLRTEQAAAAAVADEGEIAAAHTASENASAARAFTDAQRALAEARAEAITPMPLAELITVSVPGPAVVRIASVGTVLSGEAEAATLRTGTPTVTVRAAVDQAVVYELSSKVAVRTSAGERTTSGVVTAVTDFQAASDGALPGNDVTVTLDNTKGLVDGDEVLVEPASAPAPVRGLGVPLVAVREDADGNYVLRRTSRTNDEDTASTERVAVVVTSTGDGFALVEPGDLADGDVVLVSDGR